jgi:hypothetical protein
MIRVPFLARERCVTACTIEIEHTENSLHAHIDLDDQTAIRPGDRVRVHGDPIRVRFGDKLVLRREATVDRAGWLERQWTRIVSRLELADLYEVSFTQGHLS